MRNAQLMFKFAYVKWVVLDIQWFGWGCVVVMQIQSKLIWKFRDDLNNQMSKVDMCKFLRANEQTVPKGEAAVSNSG